MVFKAARNFFVDGGRSRGRIRLRAAIQTTHRTNYFINPFENHKVNDLTKTIRAAFGHLQRALHGVVPGITATGKIWRLLIGVAAFGAAIASAAALADSSSAVSIQWGMVSEPALTSMVCATLPATLRPIGRALSGCLTGRLK
jgi:hypothetical protein